MFGSYNKLSPHIKNGREYLASYLGGETVNIRGRDFGFVCVVLAQHGKCRQVKIVRTSHITNFVRFHLEAPRGSRYSNAL